MKRLLFCLLVIFIAFLAVGQSLKFALNGDDWLALWRYIKDFTSIGSFWNIHNYTNDYNNYTFADILMGVIYQVFAFNPFPYYLISLILRTLTAISFYPAVYAASKNKLAAVLSSLFFASMFAGIETTNWVFNMNTYASLALFNLFIFLFLRKDYKVFSKDIFLLSLFLPVIFFIAPTRMHGILFAIPLLAALKITKLSKKEIMSSVVIIFIFYLPIFISRFIVKATNDLRPFTNFIQSAGTEGNPVAKLIMTLSNLIIPDKVLISYVNEDTKAWLAVCLFIFLIIFFLKQLRKKFRLAKVGLFFLSLSVLFLIVPWLIFPSVLSSDHRYLLIPGAYLFVSLALFFSYLWQYKNQLLKGISFLLPLTIILVNLFALRSYFGLLTKEGRLASDADKQFAFLNSQIQQIDPNAPVAFLFIPDDPLYLYNSISFGLTSHLMLTNPKFSLDFEKSPFPVDNWNSLIDVLSSENSSELKRYGYHPVKIPLENVYIFKLQNKELINVTAAGREELKNKLPMLQQ